MDPIAIRLNNPLNLRPLGQGKWGGQIGVEYTASGAFVRFESMAHGLRAAMVNLRTYKRRYGLVTLAGVIARWAPADDPHGNHTGAYIRRVVRLTGFAADQVIDLEDPATLRPVLAAMHRVEAGLGEREPLGYAEYDLQEAFRMLGYAVAPRPQETPAPQPQETPAPEPKGIFAAILDFILELFRRWTGR